MAKFIEVHYDDSLISVNPAYIVGVIKHRDSDKCTIHLNRPQGSLLNLSFTPDETYYSVRESLALLPKEI